MKSSRWTHRAGITLATALLIALGCGPRDPAGKSPDEPKDRSDRSAAMSVKEKKIEAARAKLSTEDRALVDAQDYCVVMMKQKLGSMGVPMKVTVKGQPVFICCKGCKSTAEDEPDQTLKTAEELRARSNKK